MANLTHSLDAAHLAKTVQALRRAGVNHVAVVHDSFAVHGWATHDLRKTLMAALAWIYDRDLLGPWRAEWSAGGLELPDFPPPGDLNAKHIEASLFAFV